MNFDFECSEHQVTLRYYDGIPLVSIHTYQGVEYLLYFIDKDEVFDACSYMLLSMDQEERRVAFEIGVRTLLQAKLDAGELHHLTIGLWEDSPPSTVRLFSEEEKEEAFPMDAYPLNEELSQ